MQIINENTNIIYNTDYIVSIEKKIIDNREKHSKFAIQVRFANGSVENILLSSVQEDVTRSYAEIRNAFETGLNACSIRKTIKPENKGD